MLSLPLCTTSAHVGRRMLGLIVYHWDLIGCDFICKIILPFRKKVLLLHPFLNGTLQKDGGIAQLVRALDS